MTISPTSAHPAAVLLCTSGGLYGALVMQRLAADPRVRLCGVVLSSRVLRKDYGWLRGVWAQYRLSGLRYLLYLWAATGLSDLLSRGTVLPTVRAQAAELGCPLQVTRDINDAVGVAFVDRCAPDLLVSAFFNQRIAPAVFERPRAGAVNVHPSLLPALKGVDPMFFARLRGVQPVGVTLHRVAAELDAGKVLAQAEVPITASQSVLAATAGSFSIGADLLLMQLKSILAGEPGSPQAGAGNYDSWPTTEQVRALLESGGRLVSRDDLRAMRRGVVDWV